MITSLNKKRLAAFSTLTAMCFLMTPSWGASITHKRAPSGQHVIFLKGEIVTNDIGRMRAALKAGDDAFAITVVLESNGGVLYPAMEIGRMIRKAGASTVAVTQCASACHVIWAAGISRYVVSGTQLAIHFPYRDNKKAREAAFDAFNDLTAYYREIGATAEIALDIASADPNRLKILDSNDAKRHGLAFATIDQ